MKKNPFIIGEEEVVDVINVFFDEMREFGYDPLFIGRMIAYVLRALERKEEQE